MMMAQPDSWLDAWNTHDAAAVAAMLSPSATWCDPSLTTPGGIDRIQDGVTSLAAVLPDYRFERRGGAVTDSQRVIEWTLCGTNTGPFRADIAATGRVVALDGVDILDLDAHGVAGGRRYYDRRQFVEQLGLMVLVQPVVQGAAIFGYSMRVASDNRAAPGVIALTWIRARDAGERDRIRVHSRLIVQDFLKEPGFIGIVTGFAGDRGFTVTAWEDEAAMQRALAAQHRVARRELMTQDFVPGVWTSVWQPLRINRIWTRCIACGTLEDVSDNRRACTQCGAELPERPSFW